MCDLTPVKVTKVEPLGGHWLRLWFSDGSVGERDFADVVAGTGPMLEPLCDPNYFARVFVAFDAPTWPNGYDLAPRALHAEMAEAGQLYQAALREQPGQDLAALRADIQKGLDDLAAGRTTPFDAEEIMKRGRERLKQRNTRK